MQDHNMRWRLKVPDGLPSGKPISYCYELIVAYIDKSSSAPRCFEYLKSCVDNTPITIGALLKS